MKRPPLPPKQVEAVMPGFVLLPSPFLKAGLGKPWLPLPTTRRKAA